MKNPHPRNIVAPTDTKERWTRPLPAIERWELIIDKNELLVGSRKTLTLARWLPSRIKLMDDSLEKCDKAIRPFLLNDRSYLLKLQSELNIKSTIKSLQSALREYTQSSLGVEMHKNKIRTARRNIRQLTKGLTHLKYPQIPETIKSLLLADTLPLDADDVFIKNVKNEFCLIGDYVLLKNGKVDLLIEIKRTFKTLIDSQRNRSFPFADVWNQSQICERANIKFIFLVVRTEERTWDEVYFNRNENIYLSDYKQARNKFKKTFHCSTWKEISLPPKIYSAVHTHDGTDNLHLQLQSISQMILDLCHKRISR